MAFHRPRALARLEVPDLDLAVSRGGGDLVRGQTDRVDGTGVAAEGVEVRVGWGARVDEEGRVF